MLYDAEHGVGLQPAASGSFLKSVVVTYGRAKYVGSSMRVVTVNHVSPFGSEFTSYYSVTMASLL
jgi:hypothetical protein